MTQCSDRIKFVEKLRYYPEAYLYFQAYREGILADDVFLRWDQVKKLITWLTTAQRKRDEWNSINKD